MTYRSPVRRGLPPAIAAVLVIALILVVAVLVALALQRSGSAPRGFASAPIVPSPSTPTPSPTPTVDVVTAPGPDERFLAVGADVIWRATAGVCGETAPVIERSDDEGATWVDVTPAYRDIARVRDLMPFAETQATVIADVGADCETQALRTFSNGEFWSPYDDVLAASAYLAGSTVVIDGTSLDAPCAEPWGLRASGDTVAFLCDSTAYAITAGHTASIGDDVVALDILSGDIVAATLTPDCDGVQLALLTADGDALDCVPADAASPTAVALTDDAIWLWSSDTLITVAR